MPKNTPQLTPELIEAIAMRLKAGALEWVAVEALGVPWTVYQQWLRRASRPRCRRLYRLLADAVMQARAQARLRAEIELRDKDVKTWLLQGPGREKATREGWGPSSKTATAQDSGAEAGRFLDLCAALLEALEPFPEARAKAASLVATFQNALHERPGTASNDTL
jgi:hypothetical protein